MRYARHLKEKCRSGSNSRSEKNQQRVINVWLPSLRACSESWQCKCAPAKGGTRLRAGDHYRRRSERPGPVTSLTDFAIPALPLSSDPDGSLCGVEALAAHDGAEHDRADGFHLHLGCRPAG